MNHEFLRIKTDEVLIRTEDYLQAYARLRQRIEALRKQLPTQMSPDHIVIDVDLYSERQNHHTEQMRRRVSQQISTLEQTEIPELYRNITYNSNIYLDEHHRQQESFSCTLASTLNAMEALGQRGNFTETNVAQSVGESGREGPIVLQKSLAFLASKGFKVEHVLSTLDAITKLEEDEVVMLTDKRGGMVHEILLSGVDIVQGQITVRVNDPLETRATRIPLSELAGKIDYEVPNVYSISVAEEGKQQEEIEIVLIDE